ncbi:meiotic recombination protein REC8 homolog [Pithys albifrons albifrons]|uniref:meiotic recombination protein REC8 homolog n=1 Tax=Pithys albifrons albifrons TaxID=3385563 RepID=UPI003A5CC69C
MFYYPEVLRRHTGCFGTICSRLLRRECLRVDVPRTCAAVMSFVVGRSGWEAPPPPAGAPPPRCSLYLAALLQLGLGSGRGSGAGRAGDSLGGGLRGSGDVWVVPGGFVLYLAALLQLGLARVYGRQCGSLLEEASQILERLHRARRPLEIDLSPPRRTHLLPDSQALMMQLELAPDPFFGVMGVELLQVEELLPPPMEVEVPPGPPLTVSPESITLRELEVPSLPPPLEEELPEVTPRELQLLLEAEELLPPVEELEELPAPPALPALRPLEEPVLPPPTPEVPVARRLPRRRPPPHIDFLPSIAPELFRAQLLQPQVHCEPLLLLEPPHRFRRPASELLNAPTHEWLPPELWELWGRCAQRPALPVALPPELPSEVEVLREALEPSLPPLLSSELSLEPLEEEPLERRPLPAPAPPIVPELPEPTGAAPDLRRLILDHAQRPEGTELAAMLPPGSLRPLVAQIFALCLGECRTTPIPQAMPLSPSGSCKPCPFRKSAAS